MTLEKLRESRERLNSNCEIGFANMDMVEKESRRVVDVAHNSREILDDLDARFEKETGLQGPDSAFLFIAIGLQIARQYLLTKFPIRLDDQAAAKSTYGHGRLHVLSTTPLHFPEQMRTTSP